MAVNQRNTHKTDLAGPDSLLIKELIDGKTYLLNKLHVAADKTQFLYAACKKKEKKQSVGDHQLLAGGTTLTFKTGRNV